MAARLRRQSGAWNLPMLHAWRMSCEACFLNVRLSPPSPEDFDQALTPTGQKGSRLDQSLARVLMRELIQLEGAELRVLQTASSYSQWVVEMDFLLWDSRVCHWSYWDQRSWDPEEESNGFEPGDWPGGNVDDLFVGWPELGRHSTPAPQVYLSNFERMWQLALGNAGLTTTAPGPSLTAMDFVSGLDPMAEQFLTVIRRAYIDQDGAFIENVLGLDPDYLRQLGPGVDRAMLALRHSLATLVDVTVRSNLPAMQLATRMWGGDHGLEDSVRWHYTYVSNIQDSMTWHRLKPERQRQAIMAAQPWLQGLAILHPGTSSLAATAIAPSARSRVEHLAQRRPTA